MWKLHEWSGSVRDFHSRDLPMDTSLWLVRTDLPAIVLGSSQSETVVDPHAAALSGFDVVKRRTGGGAVLVDNSAIWIDIVLPRQHELWTDDISASMLWLGDVWLRVLSRLSPRTIFTVHSGPMVRSVVSDAVCFAGRAPGEVCVGDKKIVGISQRRGREGARFQCVVYTMWSYQWMDHVSGYGDLSSAYPSGCGLDDIGVTASPEQIASALAEEIHQVWNDR
jgi:lipoate---protein ligase